MTSLDAVFPPMTVAFCVGHFPVYNWPYADFPPEGLSIVGYEPDPRPAAIDRAGRRWMLDGSGDVA